MILPTKITNSDNTSYYFDVDKDMTDKVFLCMLRCLFAGDTKSIIMLLLGMIKTGIL